MIVVMGVMAASSLFVAAAFAAANGDLPLTRDSQDRKQAYAAAEAGSTCTSSTSTRTPTTGPAAPTCRRRTAPRTSLSTRSGTALPRAAGATSRAGRRSTRSSCCRPPARRPARRATSRRCSTQRPARSASARRAARVKGAVSSAASSPASGAGPPRLPLLHRLRDDRPDQLRDHLAGLGQHQLRQRALPASARHQRWAGRRRLRGDPVRRRRRDLGPVPHERQHPDVRHAGVRSRSARRTRSSSPSRPRAGTTRATRELVPRRVTEVQHPAPLQRHEAHDADDQRLAGDPRRDRRQALHRQDRRSASTRAT